MRYGSDLIIDFLADAGIEYVALNPGASFRGLHDSLVRAQRPRPLLTLHEEIAVGMAHGYAKSRGRPMAAFVHDLVGLQHASMALFNAWVDNVPLLVIGGSGPRDAARRRPWIDWVHSGLPQGALVRDFVKWDDEPASLEAVADSLARGLRIAQTVPMGPVYISIDVALQEQPLESEAIRFQPPEMPAALLTSRSEVAELARDLAQASQSVILVDRPDPGCFQPLTQLAERLAVAVVDLGARCSFPSHHWADQTAAQQQVLAEADLVLGLEVRDLAWGLTRLDLATRKTVSLLKPDARVVSVGMTESQHTGFLGRESLVPGTKYLLSAVSPLLRLLLEELDQTTLDGDRIEARRTALKKRHREHRERSRQKATEAASARPIAAAHLAASLWEVLQGTDWQLANGVLQQWPRLLWEMNGEDAFLGRSGGEGLGYGLPASLGAALAQKDTGRLVVDIQSDGDFMYTPGALWTAAHHQLPLLIVLYNNRSYGKDELHQKEIALARQRSLETVGIGIHIEGPAIDFAALARAQGIYAQGPVEDPAELVGELRRGAERVRTDGCPVLIDVICGG